MILSPQSPLCLLPISPSPSLPFTDIFWGPSCLCPAWGCVKGVCEGNKPLERAGRVAARSRHKGEETGPRREPEALLHPHAPLSPREQWEEWGRQQQSLWRHEEKSQGFKAKMRLKQCDWDLWMNVFHPALPLPPNTISALLLRTLPLSHYRNSGCFCQENNGPEGSQRVWDPLLPGQQLSQSLLYKQMFKMKIIKFIVTGRPTHVVSDTSFLQFCRTFPDVNCLSRYHQCMLYLVFVFFLPPYILSARVQLLLERNTRKKPVPLQPLEIHLGSQMGSKNMKFGLHARNVPFIRPRKKCMNLHDWSLWNTNPHIAREQLS